MQELDEFLEYLKVIKKHSINTITSYKKDLIEFYYFNNKNWNIRRVEKGITQYVFEAEKKGPNLSLLYQMIIDTSLGNCRVTCTNFGMNCVGSAVAEIPGVKTQEEIIAKIKADKQKNAQITTNNATLSIPEEIKKYKELLDAGAITQQEFEAKKKQLLGL